MPNPFFTFKQFTVYHDQCAMKVCTDACILGAWFAEKVAAANTVLDIGSGSGLLSLMLAQKTNATIHGIEKDEASFLQSQKNVEATEWSNRIKIFKGDAGTFHFPHRYDFIITNPPFYANDLKSDVAEKNLAKHDTGLTLDKLAYIISQNLTDDGSVAILLPYHRTEQYELLSQENGFYLHEKLLIKQTPKHNYFRSIMHFGRRKKFSPGLQELTIKDDTGAYTPHFSQLLKDYYLYL
ncbi:MAG: methyltransferase [Agriterribacter sp.]